MRIQGRDMNDGVWVLSFLVGAFIVWRFNIPTLVLVLALAGYIIGERIGGHHA